MAARILGALLVLLGVALVRHARHICEWSSGLDRRWFGWDPPEAMRMYSLLATIASGVMVAGVGLGYLVEGAAAVPG